MGKRRSDEKYLVLVAGRVKPEIKDLLLKIIEHKKWTESQYVREAVNEKVQRDHAELTEAGQQILV